MLQWLIVLFEEVSITQIHLFLSGYYSLYLWHAQIKTASLQNFAVIYHDLVCYWEIVKVYCILKSKILRCVSHSAQQR